MRQALDGGDGSGNFGHTGRPGEVGGSKKEGSSAERLEVDVKKIAQQIDFEKDNVLPAISDSDAEKIGVAKKPYLLKQSIIARNKIRHPDIDDEKAKEILAEALYKRDQIIQDAAESKSHYFHFAKFVEGHNYLVLVDFTDTKQYHEIVHYHIMRQKYFLKLIQNALEKERGVYK